MAIRSGDGLNVVYLEKPVALHIETFVILYDDSPEQTEAAHQVAERWAEDRWLHFNWKDKYNMSKKIAAEYCKRLDSDCKGK